MKLGPFILSRNGHTELAERPSSRPETGERGATGTQVFGGILTAQDYNPDLQAPGCYEIYDRMRLSDGQVRSAMAVVKLPILRAEWSVEEASDSAQDKEIAEFIETGLMNMTRPWKPTLREIMLHLDYGSQPFEKVWEMKEGKVHLRKLAPRAPKTILKWLVDTHGGLAGIQQATSTSAGFQVIDIPSDKLLVFVNEQEGANFRGISMLRAAYKHWYFKDGHYRVDAIANERRGVGVDIGTIKAGATDKGQIKDKLERALMTLHAHEKQFFVEDEENYTYRQEAPSARGGANAIMASIEHHDLRILRSILAEFLAMGQGSTGSLAMHRDKSSFFLMALEAVADNVVDTMNTYLIRQWVDYNWQVREYPRLRYSRLDTRDVKAIADAVSQLMTAGALTPTRDTEDELREIIELPELPDEDDEPMPVPTNVLPIAARKRLKRKEKDAQMRDHFERRTQERLAAHFRRWAKRIDVAALIADIHSRRDIALSENPDGRDYREAVLEAWPSDDTLTDVVSETYLVTANGAGRAALAELGIGGPFELRGENAIQALRTHAAEMVKGIDDVSQQRVRRILAAGIDRGAHPDEIARDLRSEFDDWSIGRSQAIARTETNWAWSRTTQEAFVRNGITARRWVSIQEDPDEQCAVNERAGAVPIGEPFPFGDMHPAAHTLCRCTIIAANIEGWEPPDEPWRGEG